MKCNDTHLCALNGFTCINFSSKRNLTFSMEDKRRGEEMKEGREKKTKESKKEEKEKRKEVR